FAVTSDVGRAAQCRVSGVGAAAVCGGGVDQYSGARCGFQLLLLGECDFTPARTGMDRIDNVFPVHDAHRLRKDHAGLRGEVLLVIVIGEDVKGYFKQHVDNEEVPIASRVSHVAYGEFFIDKGQWKNFTMIAYLSGTGLSQYESMTIYALRPLVRLPTSSGLPNTIRGLTEERTMKFPKNLDSEFVVMTPDKQAVIERCDAEIYTRLDQNYDNFAGHELISSYEFQSDWSSWEMHPQG